MGAEPYVLRLVDDRIARLMSGLPAVMVVGPRGSGKTTTARRFARTEVRLDREIDASPLRDDPDAVLRSLEPPVLLDEWQLVPGLLGSVKRAVDDERGAGRFILTGSVRAELLHEMWAATGRIVRVTEWGMCQRELVGSVGAPSFFDRAFGGELAEMAPAARTDLRSYVDIAMRGMLPEAALQPSEELRRAWLAAYVDQLVTRDAALASEDRDPVKLRRYLVALASSSAGVVEHKVLFDAAGISRLTATAYDGLLEMLFVAERVPAWHSNRLKRLTRSPKRYIVEPALLGPLLGVDERGVIRNGDVLGRVIDSFVLAQLRPEVECSHVRPRLYHLRLDGGRHECDLIAEAPDGRVVGIEIKSTGAPNAGHATHLAWLRDQLGDQFVGGIVFHTGPWPFALGDRLHALPISSIWAT